MYVLVGRRWRRGVQDEWCGPEACRIDVQQTIELGPVHGAYFVQPRNLRRVLNYVREIGPTQVVRKILSRRQETYRNAKYLSLISGTIVESPAGDPAPGTRVVALCTLHPRASERVVVDRRLVRSIDQWPGVEAAPVSARLSPGHAQAAQHPTPLSALDNLTGWHHASGASLTDAEIQAAFAQACAMAGAGPLSWRKPDADRSDIVERSGTDVTVDGRTRVALFGYGQYAKTIVLPNLDRRLRLAAIHDADPLQLKTARGRAPVLDTCPWPRSDDRYDVYFAAGYHHTHAPIAIHALNHGASVIVEKPPVTTRKQLDALLQTWRASGGHVYVCFQRRFAAFTPMARQDLDAAPEAAVSYRCFVYEVPLPRRHWYRWPTSQGRVVSNGCHWIDHFLYVNDYAPVVSYDAWTARNGDSVCMAELENGATFSMAMTDRGSDCIGMQNVIELRSDRGTVRIINDSEYRAEDSRGLRRRARHSKMDAFAAMYRAVSEAAVERRALDTPDTLEASAGLMLDLEALVGGHLDRPHS